MMRYECKTAQPGYAAGRAFVVRSRETGGYLQGSPSEELERLERAAEELNRRLVAGREKGSPAEAALMDAEGMILNGEEFLGEARRAVREEGLSAPEAVDRAAEKLCALLRESGADYIRERCEDVRGLAAGLNAQITGKAQASPAEPCILAAAELSPGELMMIGTEHLRGIVTETGSPTSHVSVLAGNLGIPYLYGLERIREKVGEGDFLILQEGSVCVDPPEEEIRAAQARQAAVEKEREALRTGAAAVTTRTAVCANISRAEEADGLVKAGADGVGLFRSEFLFLDRTEAPSEEEQYAACRHAVEALDGREVVIRTMDIGSDKKARWLEMPEEINPALGLRGLRVSLAHRDLFRTQLRALLRAAAHGKVKVMIPMVTSVWELDEAEKELRAAARELEERGEPYALPELGVMIETPAAVMIAPALAKNARFFSIGTNDLTQYTLAVDREAKGLDPYFDPLHDAVLRMIALTAEAAHAQGIPVAVCGELAGDDRALEQLIRLGVDELSVSPAKLARVRRRVADIEEKLDRESRKKGIRSPAEGELIPMEEIPDPVFSGGVMGECIGILSTDGRIYAPLSGTVTTVAATRHAVSFRGEGTEILVHVGLDTVKLKGEGFRLHVREGDTVQQGQLVMEADLDLIRARGFNPMVIAVRIGAGEKNE